MVKWERWRRKITDYGCLRSSDFHMWVPECGPNGFGRGRGFRVPGSRFRRIPRDALVAFMKDNGIPPDSLDSGKQKVLVVDDDPEIVELFVDVLDRDGRFEVKTASTGYDAGILTKEFMPDLIIL